MSDQEWWDEGLRLYRERVGIPPNQKIRPIMIISKLHTKDTSDGLFRAFDSPPAEREDDVPQGVPVDG